MRRACVVSYWRLTIPPLYSTILYCGYGVPAWGPSPFARKEVAMSVRDIVSLIFEGLVAISTTIGVLLPCVADRAVSVAAWGLASGKIGKQYECKKCGHKW